MFVLFGDYKKHNCNWNEGHFAIACINASGYIWFFSKCSWFTLYCDLIQQLWIFSLHSVSEWTHGVYCNYLLLYTDIHGHDFILEQALEFCPFKVAHLFNMI